MLGQPELAPRCHPCAGVDNLLLLHSTGRCAAPLLPSAQEDLKKKQRAERFGISVPMSKEEFEVSRGA